MDDSRQLGGALLQAERLSARQAREQIVQGFGQGSPSVGGFEPSPRVAALHRERLRALQRRAQGLGVAPDVAWRRRAAAAAAVGGALPLGLHTVQLGREEAEGFTRAGSDAQQFDDVATLGASLLRDVAWLDLSWSNLSGGAPVPVGHDAVILAISTDTNADRIATLVKLAAERGVQVVLRALVFGARERESFPFPYAPEKGIVTGFNDSTRGVIEPLLHDWSTDHPAGVDGGPTSRYVDSSTDRGLLDIRNAYERDYLRAMAIGVAMLLRAVEARLVPKRLSLLRVIAGVALFDECDDRNVVHHGDSGRELREADADESAYHWGRAWVPCALALRNMFKDTRLARLPLHLPGLGSYYEDWQPHPYWWGRNCREYREQFLARFLLRARIELVRDDNNDGWSLPDIAQGIDLHWDHRATAVPSDKPELPNKIAPQHILQQEIDLTRLRAILDAAGLTDATLTVLRSGSSVDDPDDAVPTWIPGASLAARQARFQAMEVWRRLPGALAAGADAAGWQAWVSTNRGGGSREFYGMGLREDEQSDRSPPGDARQRLSWFAYQRMTETLGAMVAARFAHPSLPASDAWDATVEVDGLVIVELRGRLGSRSAHAYLILVDPTWPDAETGWWLGASSFAGAATCRMVATLPTAVPIGTGTENSTLLPTRSATFAADRTLRVPFTMVMQPGDDPILLLSTHELRVELGVRL